MSTGTLSPKDIDNKEQDTAIDPAAFENEFGKDFSGAEKKEMNDLNDQVGKGFTGDDSTGKKKFWTPRKKITGGIAGLFVGGAVGIFSIIQGPLGIIHAGQLLQQFHFSSDEEFMDSRAGKTIRWLRTRGSEQRRNFGVTGNALADRYEAKLRNAGMEPRYNTSGRIDAITFDENNPKARAALAEMQANGIEPEDLGDGKYRVDLETGLGSTRPRRRFLKSVVGGIGLNKVSSAVSKRVLTTRGGVDWHPLKNAARDLDEGLSEYWKRVREDRNQRRAQGDIDKSNFDGRETEGEDGETRADPENDRLAGESNDLLDGSRADVRGKVRGALTGGVGFATAATLICTVKQIGDAIPETKQATVILPLMRTGIEIVAMGNQVMTGQDVNLDELGATVTQFYDESAEPDAQSFFSAMSIQAELGQEQTGVDMPGAAKPTTDKPAIFHTIDNIISSIPGGGTVCDAVTSTVGGWLVDITDWATSGGPVRGVVAAIQDLAVGAAAGSFVDDLVGWLVGEPIVLDASGALLGNYANYGALLAANESAISHGGAALGQAQVTQLDQEREQRQLAQMQQKGWVDRYLNPYETQSLVAVAFLENPGINTNGSAVHALGSPFTALSSSFSSFSRLFVPEINAANTYDYGFPEFGFSVEEMDSERYENPFENADRVEPNLEELNEKYGECFGTTIDPNTLKIQTNIDEGIRYDEIDKDKCRVDQNDSQSEINELNDYRFYLADQFTIKSLLCYEGLDDSACAEVGFGGAPPAGGAPTGNADPGEDTSSYTCPEGTEDGGVHQDYGPGSVPTVKIRICGIPNAIPASKGVNVSIAEQSLAMIEAMRAAGLNPTGSAFRSYERQQELRVAHCRNPETDPASACTPATAPAGNSMHEVGLAIDFSDMCFPNGATCPGNDRWEWLTQNAASYGFTKLSSEAWHWSVGGR